MKIPTYVINIKTREDRLFHIEREFKDRGEFDVHITEAITHKFGNLGLWHSIKQIVDEAFKANLDYVLICEDDHLFTADYNSETIFAAISEAQNNLADVLFGGVSWFEDAIQISDKLFSVKKFSGTQFTIVFKKFYQILLDAKFGPQDIADGKMSQLSDSMFFMSPFISVQKEFGYSDATHMNHGTQRVQSLFFQSAVRAKIINNVRKHYSKSYDFDSISKSISLDENWSVPTYILNLPERKDRRDHILKQFDGRYEFGIQVVEAVKHKVGAYGHWQSFRKIISIALENDDDVIVICEDDHEFTQYYDRTKFLREVFFAHMIGCDYMTGGSGKFDIAVPLSEDLFWTNYCFSTQFIVVYKKFFQKILDTQFDESVVGDMKLSELTENKLIMVPAISVQKAIGVSDITALHNEQEGIVQDMFQLANERLHYMQLIYSAYKSGMTKSLLENRDLANL
jgi:GR25 family glycosyltransferase involved in LPS biosynthesis